MVQKSAYIMFSKGFEATVLIVGIHLQSLTKTGACFDDSSKAAESKPQNK